MISLEVSSAEQGGRKMRRGEAGEQEEDEEEKNKEREEERGAKGTVSDPLPSLSPGNTAQQTLQSSNSLHYWPTLSSLQN